MRDGNEIFVNGNPGKISTTSSMTVVFFDILRGSMYNLNNHLDDH